METVKAIVRYIRMSKVFKGAVRQAIETFYKESLKTTQNK